MGSHFDCDSFKDHLKKNGVSIKIDENLDAVTSKLINIENGFLHQKDLRPSNKWLFCRWNANLLRSALPCLVFLVVYGFNDSIHFLPRMNDLYCVNFHNISALDYRLFSGHPPHQFFSLHSNHLLDLAAALPYLFHYSIPVFFPLFLVFSGMKEKVSRFFRLLGLAMWSHYFIWFLLPTAPPWLADKLDELRSQQVLFRNFDPDSLKHLQREGCAFSRLDAKTGWGFFKSIFDGNPVPFASFPSGHVAWPVCMAMTASWSRRGKVIFFMYIAWVGWSTMYSCHHYFSDMLAAILVVIIMEYMERKFANVR